MSKGATQRTVARLACVLAFLVALAFACILFGAIPWVTVPTLGQAIWASGFAQSYANAGGFAIYATDFGLPIPAPIAFGLSATFVQGLIIHLFGVAAIDAYTLTAVLYLALALHGSTSWARSHHAPFALAVSLGLLWLALPIVWNHVGYSMLALGFALLPFYKYATDRLLTANEHISMIVAATRFLAACIISVFMDGYTFMMFFVASVVLGCARIVTDGISRTRSMLFSLPCMIAGFALAYLLYTAFIGRSGYAAHPLAMFRALGADVTMLIAPTRGAHWLWDAIGLSVPRSMNMFWGDGSIWMTTFIFPLLLVGVAGFMAARDYKQATPLLIIGVVGIYLSLGPSLKINDTKSGLLLAKAGNTYLMPEKYAPIPTGSAWLSRHVPGFKQMRASYRWIGLGMLGFWMLSVLLTIRLHGRRTGWAYALVLLLIICFIPDFRRTLQVAVANRKNVHAIDAALDSDLHAVAGDHGVLFFAPYGNDFIVPYLAATDDFTSYNIGGDKNVELAQSAWSERMLTLNSANLGSQEFLRDMRSILLVGQVNAIVLPYFDMLQAALQWPPSNASVHTLREQRLPIARATATSPCFQLQNFPMFSAVSLSDFGRREQEHLFANSANADAAAELAQACRLTE